MGCGSSKPVEYEARVARVSKTDVTATEATYCWVCKPGSKEWQGESVGAGADLGLCLAILSAKQAWPVLDLTPVKQSEWGKVGVELMGVAAEAAMG